MIEITRPSVDESAESTGDAEDLRLARARWAALEAGTFETVSLDEIEVQMDVDR